MNRIQPRRLVRQIGLLGVVSVAAVAVLSGCSSGSSNSSDGGRGFSEAKQDKNSTITVWVDASRAPAVEAFEKANPSIKVKTVTYDGSANGSNSFKTKMALYDRAGKRLARRRLLVAEQRRGVGEQKVAGKQAFAARLDKGLVPEGTLSGFSKGALNPCTVDGGVYCLRNDLAQTVLWYDNSLLKKFGYAVPKTWEEYQALGEKVAKEHPGYIVGSVGDTWTPEVFMWSSKCQANDVTGIRTVTVKTDSTECKRAASMLDTLVANKSHDQAERLHPGLREEVHRQGPDDARTGVVRRRDLQQQGVAQRPQGPAGRRGAARVGRRLGRGRQRRWWHVVHLEPLEEPGQLRQVRRVRHDGRRVPGRPRSRIPRVLGGCRQVGRQAGELRLLRHGPVRADGGRRPRSGTAGASRSFSQEAIWAKTITPLVSSGKSIEENLAAWGTAIKNQAKVNGYQVND